MTPDEVAAEVTTSGLRGRGGAGFPTGTKWSFLAKDHPRYLCVNADESEPGCFKDRYLIEENPHQLIEGTLISAYATESPIAFIYIRGEYRAQRLLLERAVEEACAAGYIGQEHPGQRLELRAHRPRGRGCLHLRRGDGAARLPRGAPRPAPAQAALPGGQGSLRAADGRQQRRDPLQPALHRHRGGRQVRRDRYREAAPGAGSSASAGTSSGRATTRCSGHHHLPRAAGRGVWRGLEGPLDEGDAARGRLDADAAARSTSICPSTSRRWPTPDRPWVRGRWSSWTRPPAWSTCPCAWSTSTSTSPAASASPCREGTYFESDLMHRLGAGLALDQAELATLSRHLRQHGRPCFCLLGDTATWFVMSAYKMFPRRVRQPLRSGTLPGAG